MSNIDQAVILLTAGHGTRMKSRMAKALHRIGGAPLLHHAMNSAQALKPSKMIVVVGSGDEADNVARSAVQFDPSAIISVQNEQLGTAHAVMSATDALSGFVGVVTVHLVDVPLMSGNTLRALASAAEGNDMALLSFHAQEPGRNSRVLVDESNFLSKLVSFKDASSTDLSSRLCFSGLLSGKWEIFSKALDQVTNDNVAGEYYIGDLVEVVSRIGGKISCVTCEEEEAFDVNDRVSQATIESLWQQRERLSAMQSGVTLVSPETTQMAFGTTFGRDVVVDPYSSLEVGRAYPDGAHILPTSAISATFIQEALKGRLIDIHIGLAAISEMIEHERERVRGRNIETALKVDERDKQLALFDRVLVRVDQISENIPNEDAEITHENVEDLIRILRSFKQEVVQWCDENITEVVDGGNRLILIGATSAIFGLFGAPMIGMGVGSVFFGGKKAAELAKAIKG